MATSLTDRPPHASTSHRPTGSVPAKLEARRLAHLVRAARQRDHAAWEELVARFGGLVRAVARGHRLTGADVAEVTQTTWLRAVENLHRLEHPERLGGWLATVARRESLRVLRERNREVPTEDEMLARQPDPSLVDAELLAAEREAALWRAVGALPPRQQALVETLLQDSVADYGQIGAKLSMPIGSIGPTRGRAFERLRRDPNLVAVTEAA
ncbi:MAG: sigma-70 family RNA polymerase sigma factor [Actinomycetota bacterium]|nr:sigma-70 family RNA polymerase sigma factor [Actinomycetota bacterium]